MSPTEWAEVRALWFAVQDLPSAERDAALADPSVTASVRRQVEELLSAADAVGDRFEQPALHLIAFSEPEPTLPSLVGTRLGPYEVVRRVGQGGMGVVYEAHRADAAYDQRVAIKTVWRGVDSTVLQQRFRTERQILAALEHPNIARLLDGGATEAGTPWLAMEFVDGVPIDAYCDDERLSLEARLDLFRQVCAAVQFAHRHGVVHRDIKPSNVLITPDGTAKLLDFGVAKLLNDPRGDGTLTSAGLSPFTAAYAAPEQVAGGEITVATDVYALGALLMTLLVGRPPLLLESMAMADLMDAIRHQPARAPSVLALEGDGAMSSGVSLQEVAVERGFASREQLARALHGELDAIALMALRKEPARRYASAEALADDVHRHLRRQQVQARPDTVGYRLRSLARRNRALMTAGVIAGSALLLVGISTAWQRRADAKNQAAAADRLQQIRTLTSALVFDANDRLVDVPGATSARAALVSTALQSLDRLAVDAPRDPGLLQEMAMAYQRAGDLLGNPTSANLGDLAGSRDAYAKAIAAAELLMREAPDAAASAWTLALVYEKAADVEAPSGQLREALSHQRASLRLFTQVSASDTTRLGYLRAVGISSMKLGDLLGHPTFANAGDTAAAIAAYAEANRRLERAARRGDTTYALARHRAIVHERLGRLMQERRDRDSATFWLQRSLALRDSLLAAHPTSVEARRDMAIGLYLLCGLHLDLQQPDEAVAPCQRSLEIRRHLLADDPSDARLVRGMGIMHRRLGEVHNTLGQPARALREYDEAAAFYERYFGGRAGPLNDRRDYAYLHAERALIADALGARVAAARSRAIAAAALDSVAPRSPLTAQDSALLRRVRPARS